MTKNRKKNTNNSQKVIQEEKQNIVLQVQPFIQEQSLFEIFDNVVKYIEKNLKVVTWLVTSTVAIVAAGLKFIWYVLDAGKLSYWKINYSAISVMNENTLYNIFLTLSFSVLVIFFMLIPYGILKLEWKRKIKVICFLVLYIVVAAFFFIGLKAWTIIEDFAWVGFIVFLIVTSICYVLYLVPSVFLHFCDWLNKNRKLKKKTTSISLTSIVIGLTIWIAVVSTYAYCVGKYVETLKIDFRVVATGYAIIHENDKYYYMAEIEDGVIHRDAQKIVEKGSIEYTWQRVNEVR